MFMADALWVVAMVHSMSRERKVSRMNDDTISRQAAISAMDCVTDSICAQQAIDALIGLPSAERRGRWVDVEHAPGNLFYATCSICGERQTIEVANYCPMCGASMMDDNAIQHTKCVGNALDALDEVKE